MIENSSSSRGTTVNVGSDLTFKIANTRAEREAAFHLVYQAYLRAGLGQPNTHRMRVTPYHLLETTEIFCAVQGNRMLATMSLIMDGDLGLPIEAVYADVVTERRRQRLQLGEVSCLALAAGCVDNSFEVFCGMSRMMVQYARKHGLDQLLIAVHPRHARFYERYMFFERVGGLRSYPSVCDRPAIALCMDFERIDRVVPQKSPQRWEQFFGNKIGDKQLLREPIGWGQSYYFSTLMRAGDNFIAPMGGDESPLSFSVGHGAPAVAPAA